VRLNFSFADVYSVSLRAGNDGVGKSALVESFASDGTQFPKNYTMVSCLDEWCGMATMVSRDCRLQEWISV